MRKLSAIMLALLLVSGVAMAQVTVSGTVDWSSLYASDDGTADMTARGRAETKFTAPVDDYNTAVVKLRYADTDFDSVQEAYFDTDWAGAFGLDQAAPVGLDSRMGYHEYDNPEYGKVTGQTIENVDGMGDRDWNYQIVLSALDLVNLQVNVAPGSADSSGGRDLAVGAYGGGDFDFGTLNAELFFYAEDGAEAGDGNILFGLGYSNTIVPDLVDLSVGTTFDYYLADVADDTAEWALGAGVSATFIEMVTLGIGLAGDSEAPAGALGVDLGVSYMDLIGFDLGVVLGLDEKYSKAAADQETLDYLEASVVLMVGAGNFRVGYAYDGQDDGTAGNIDTDYKIGGKFSDLGDAAKGAVFVRTSINY